MNINPSQFDKIIKTYLRNPNEKRRANEKVKQQYFDEVSISEEVRELAKAVKLASGGEEVKAEKVAKLKEQIGTGTYNIDGKLVAEKIIEEHFGDRFI
ncbi:MAG: flagellar biosynthesis anti-sigma factor FlgM [Tepidanaerobacteraceae bacterium]|jgi:negative regulator of flagellin synthesis FlgM|nr:flagellar biosynthesis anti-sigma factor FlgM [Thermoanaerobacterales bacterium]